MKIKTILFTAGVYLLCTQSTRAQTKVDAAGLSQLQSGLQSLAKDDCLVHANWGFCLMDPVNGKILASHEPEKSLTPASGMKAITTMVALNTLGADYRYATYLEIDGTLGKDSVLHGNVYIRGTGDPTLGCSRYDSVLKWPALMEQWAKVIKSKGINHITGKIIADASAFEDYAQPGSWNWDDIGQYYGAGPYGLNINENAYTIYYSSTTVSATIDSIVPEIEGLTIHSDVTVSGTSDNAYIYGAPDDYYRYVVGSIPAKRKAYTVNGSMPDPPLFLATECKKALIKQNIRVDEMATTVYAMKRAKIKVNYDRKVIHTYYSPTLRDIVAQTNLHSINLYAETLLKTVALVSGKDGSVSTGQKMMQKYWSDAGMDISGYNQEDGSGLSRLNFLTTHQMCSFLSHETKQTTFTDYTNSLPIAGKTGTLENIADHTAAEGRIFAKSGSMYKVRSYSGYVLTKNGELLTFSVIVDNYTCGSAEIRSKLEKIMIWMAAL